MRLEIYRKFDEIILVQFYPCIAIIFEPSAIQKPTITRTGIYQLAPKDPTDIVVRDIPNTRMILDIMTNEMGYVRRLNLMS